MCTGRSQSRLGSKVSMPELKVYECEYPLPLKPSMVIADPSKWKGWAGDP